MSDQGELDERRSASSDDTNGLETDDFPTGEFPKVAGSHVEDDDTAGAGWNPAERLTFSAEERSDGGADDGGRWRPDDTREAYPGDAAEWHPQDAGDRRSDDAQDQRFEESQDQRFAGADVDSGPRPGWERSLFDDSGMDSGPGDPRYQPVDMSGPSTPPKPGTPSSGNLRLPDWMKESTDPDDVDTGGKDKDKGKRGGKDKGKRKDKRKAEDQGPAEGAGRTDGTAPRRAADPFEDESAGSRTVLIAGVGLLVVALLAAGGVFLLRTMGGSDSPAGAGTVKEPEPKQVAVSLPPDKPLKRFRGKSSKVVGTVEDAHAGLSYPKFGTPWVAPTKQNGLAQRGWSGQQIVVTEKSGGQIWYGQLLSGTLSTADRNAYRGAGAGAGAGGDREAAVAVSNNILQRSYAFKHTTVPFASQALDVDGHKGWLVSSVLRYKRAGVKATSDLVVVAVINTGRKTPAVLFVAIPNTHDKLWPDINHLIENLHVIS